MTSVLMLFTEGFACFCFRPMLSVQSRFKALESSSLSSLTKIVVDESWVKRTFLGLLAVVLCWLVLARPKMKICESLQNEPLGKITVVP